VSVEEVERSIAEEEAVEEKMGTDDDTMSRVSDDSDEGVSETIEFYVGLLMNLIPSMERTYNQSLLDGQKGDAVSRLDASFPHLVLPDYSESSKDAAG
jgi:hypothetical protein